MFILFHIRLNIDMDTLIPITEHDEKKVSHACLIDQIILIKQAHAMLCRDADMMPARWR